MVSYEGPADPPDEIARQRAVDMSGILKRPLDARIQEIAARAAALFEVPMAVISIIDRRRQWFAARHNVDMTETPRNLSFCAHAIHRPGEALVIPDTTRDRRFAEHPMVLGEPHVRFYAGMPIVDKAGYPLGALCVADSKPHFAPTKIFELTLLAREAESLIAR